MYFLLFYAPCRVYIYKIACVFHCVNVFSLGRRIYIGGILCSALSTMIGGVWYNRMQCFEAILYDVECNKFLGIGSSEMH
jgi:hypothetical protein